MGRAWVRIDKQRNWQRDIFKKVLATYFNICYFNFEQSLHHTQMGLKSEIWTGLLIRCYFVNILWTRGKEYEVLIDCGGKSLEDLTVETITASSLLQTIHNQQNTISQLTTSVKDLTSSVLNLKEVVGQLTGVVTAQQEVMKGLVQNSNRW